MGNVAIDDFIKKQFCVVQMMLNGSLSQVSLTMLIMTFPVVPQPLLSTVRRYQSSNIQMNYLRSAASPRSVIILDIPS